MEKKAQTEQQRENINSSELEKYESPQVTLCDIKETSNGFTNPTPDTTELFSS
jgi:hypothetical protein